MEVERERGEHHDAGEPRRRRTTSTSGTIEESTPRKNSAVNSSIAPKSRFWPSCVRSSWRP